MVETVEELKLSADSIKEFLTEKGEISLVVTAEDVWRKSVLIAAASHFEHELGMAIERSARRRDVPEDFRSLIETKAISRQFYNYFDFDSSNTNKLFRAFGATCKSKAESKIRDSKSLRESQSAFLKICALRNQMVHSNYASFNIDLTTEEIYLLYRRGCKFIEFFEAVISDWH
jgi:HEPN superfamily RiboL-PSP-like protein